MHRVQGPRGLTLHSQIVTWSCCTDTKCCSWNKEGLFVESFLKNSNLYPLVIFLIMIRCNMKRMQNKEMEESVPRFSWLECMTFTHLWHSPTLCKLTTKSISTSMCSFQSTCLELVLQRTQITFLLWFPLVLPIDIWGDDIHSIISLYMILIIVHLL